MCSPEEPGEQEMSSLACKCPANLAPASESIDPPSDGTHWANVQALSISIDDISFWNSLTPFPRAGDLGEGGGAAVNN